MQSEPERHWSARPSVGPPRPLPEVLVPVVTTVALPQDARVGTPAGGGGRVMGVTWSVASIAAPGAAAMPRTGAALEVAAGVGAPRADPRDAAVRPTWLRVRLVVYVGIALPLRALGAKRLASMVTARTLDPALAWFQTIIAGCYRREAAMAVACGISGGLGGLGGRRTRAGDPG